MRMILFLTGALIVGGSAVAADMEKPPHPAIAPPPPAGVSLPTAESVAHDDEKTRALLKNTRGARSRGQN
jgi:hypothetical protein